MPLEEGERPRTAVASANRDHPRCPGRLPLASGWVPGSQDFWVNAAGIPAARSACGSICRFAQHQPMPPMFMVIVASGAIPGLNLGRRRPTALTTARASELCVLLAPTRGDEP